MRLGVFLRVLCVWSLAFTSVYAQNEVLLRDSKVECGLYFTDDLQMQGTRIGSLDAKEFKQALQTLENIPKKMGLALVGVTPADNRRLKEELKVNLKELGYDDVPVISIRRLASFIEQETGVFVRENDAWRRIAKDATELELVLTEHPEYIEQDILVAGIPVLSKARREIDQTLNQHGVDQYNAESHWKTFAKKAARQPVAATGAVLQKLRYLLPVREDFVPPTTGEYRSAVQKIMVPGVLTFTVMLSQSQPLEVLVPVTVINAINSFTTGTFRTFLGNWSRRSKNIFPEQWIKNIMVSSFFSIDLYWAGRGSVAKFSEIATIAGWQNFITTKWLSVLFSTLWRTPVNMAIFQWEGQRLKKEHGQAAQDIRQAGAAVEKYLSYVMTQFYLYSLVTKDSLFNVVYANGEGLKVVSDQAFDPSLQTMLMGVNYGHIAMISVGVMAFTFMKNMKVLDYVSAAAFRVDRVESGLLNGIGGAWQRFFQFWRSPRGPDDVPRQSGADSI